MKVSKDQFKTLIKECLVEILAEGLGNNLVESRGFKQPVKKIQGVAKTPVRSQKPAYNPALDEVVKFEAGGNSIMQEILADTAAKTLPAIMEAERSGPVLSSHGPGATKEDLIVAQTTPEELFGADMVSKWSSVAFAEPKLPK